MKNKLLLSSLLSLSILAFSGTAKAQESADATFTGTLGASTEVIKLNDGLGIINPDTGFLEGIGSPAFQVTTSQPTGTNGRLTAALVSDAPTLFFIEEAGVGGIALTNGTPETSAVLDVATMDPTVENNPNVIAYQLLVVPAGQPQFEFNDGGLEGVILDEPGSNNVPVIIEPEPRAGTFGTNDEAGNYTANFTLTAVSSL